MHMCIVYGIMCHKVNCCCMLLIAIVAQQMLQ